MNYSDEQNTTINALTALLHSSDPNNFVLALQLAATTKPEILSFSDEFLHALLWSYYDFSCNTSDDKAKAECFEQLQKVLQVQFEQAQNSNNLQVLVAVSSAFLYDIRLRSSTFNKQAILDVMQQLLQDIPLALQIQFMFQTGHSPFIVKASSLLRQLDYSQDTSEGFVVFRAFVKGCSISRTGTDLGGLYPLFEQVVAPILDTVSTFKKSLQWLHPDTLTLIQNLWQTATAAQYAAAHNQQIVAVLLAIMQKDAFDQRVRQQIMAQYTQLFVFTQRHLERMGGMGHDSDENIYDTAEASVLDYIEIALHVLPHIDFEHWSTGMFHQFCHQINAVWKYYFLIEMAPFLEAANAHKQQSDLCFSLGQLYFKSGQSEQSEQYFKQYLLLCSDCSAVESYFFLCEMQYQHITFLPHAADALSFLGKLYEQQAKPQQALFYYRNAIQQYPRHPLAPYINCIRLLLQGQVCDAEAFQLLKDYFLLLTQQISWQNEEAYTYNEIELTENRYRMLQHYHFLCFKNSTSPSYLLALSDFNDFLYCCFHLFYAYADYLCYTCEQYDPAFDYLMLCLAAKNKYESRQGRIEGYKPHRYKKILPFSFVKIDYVDVLKLQAALVTETKRDYWQALSLYKKALKISPVDLSLKLAIQSLNNKLY